MSYLWNYLDRKKWTAAGKYRAALWAAGLLAGLAGFLLWSIVRIRAMDTWEWMICFVGHPVIISWFAVFFYSCKHDFHNGRRKRQQAEQH